jgi:hypothetical protein
MIEEGARGSQREPGRSTARPGRPTPDQRANGASTRAAGVPEAEQLQAVGVKASRAFTILFDGVVGVALTVYALFISNFLDT